MTNIVPSEDIESIVGTFRRRYTHIGYADSNTGTFYILHSEICKETCPDLRDCDYSVALDKNKVEVTVLDQPKYIMLSEGTLIMFDLFGEE